MRTGTLAGFVRVDAALDAPGDGGAEQTAHDGIGTECAVNDQGEDIGNLLPVDANDNDGDNNVGLCHEGHDDTRELSDTLQAAEDDEAQYRRNDGSADRFINAEGFVPRRRDRVALHTRAENARSEDRHDGECPGIGLALQALFNIESRTAAVLVLNLFFVNLAERRFDKCGRGAEECHYPHPEKCAWATVADGGGNASNSAGSYATGKGHRQSLKAGKSDLAFAALENQTPHFRNHAELNKSRADRKEEASNQAQADERRRPNNVV